MRVARIVGNLEDSNLFSLVHLHCGKANPIMFLHGFDHIIDKFLDFCGIDLIDR